MTPEPDLAQAPAAEISGAASDGLTIGDVAERTGLTTAVKTVDWPDCSGLFDDVTTVLVDAFWTVCVAVAVLPRKLSSPL